MARAFFRPPTLGRRPLKTGNRKWAGFPRAGKPTSQVGGSEPLENGAAKPCENTGPPVTTVGTFENAGALGRWPARPDSRTPASHVVAGGSEAGRRFDGAGGEGG